MNSDQLEIWARRAASHVTDNSSRAGLAEKFREAAALTDGTIGGLHLAAADRGLCLNTGVDAHLQMLNAMLHEVAEQIASGDLFVSPAEVAAARAERDDWYAAYDRNPRYGVTRSDLNRVRAAGFVDGLTVRESVTA